MSDDVFAMPVHEAAAKFPMLAADELADLAADIKQNGLAHPIVVKDGQLIDGRNRREACRIAGIVPTTVELNGGDPRDYIISSNINRRHLTKGQRAMAVALIYPEADRGRGHIDRARKGAESASLSYRRIQECRAVIKWAPDLVDQVLQAAEKLDKAYEIATDRKRKETAPVLRLNALRAKDPDLADKVIEEQISLDDAEGAATARRDKERAARQGTYDALKALERYFFMFRESSHREELVKIIQNNPQEISASGVIKTLTEWHAAIEQTIGELHGQRR